MTNLGRTIDLRVWSNRFAIAAAAVSGAIGLFFGGGWGEAIALGGASFLAWVAGRELDPDHPAAAGVAAVLAPLAVWNLGRPSLIAVYLLAVSVRMLTRSTGLPPKSIDLAFHLPICLIAAWAGLSAVSAICFGAAVILDVFLSNPAPRRQIWWGSGIVISSILLGFFMAGAPSWSSPTLFGWTVLVAAIASGLLPVGAVRSSVDTGTGTLDPRRIEVGRRLTATLSLVAVVLAGGDGIVVLSPFLVAVALSGAAVLNRHSTAQAAESSR